MEEGSSYKQADVVSHIDIHPPSPGLCLLLEVNIFSIKVLFAEGKREVVVLKPRSEAALSVLAKPLNITQIQRM